MESKSIQTPKDDVNILLKICSFKILTGFSV